jgi:hypothetical protein
MGVSPFAISIVKIKRLIQNLFNLFSPKFSNEQSDEV